MPIKKILQNNPVIAAVQYENIDQALDSDVSAVLLMYTKLVNLMDEKFKHYGKKNQFSFILTYLKDYPVTVKQSGSLRAT